MHLFPRNIRFVENKVTELKLRHIADQILIHKNVHIFNIVSISPVQRHLVAVIPH